jgi:serine protease Do
MGQEPQAMRSFAGFCKRSSLVAVLAVLLTWTGSARAQQIEPDLYRNNPKVVKLFRPVIAPVTASTVRVQCDGKDAALGAVVHADGWIITKASALKGKVVCRFKDSKEFPAKIVGVQEPFDLALLKIETTGLSPVEWRHSKEAKVGRWVATTAISEDPVAIGVICVATRPLVVGDQPPKTFRINSGWLGVGLEDAEGAARITMVSPNSPAQSAGLKAKDVVTHVDAKKVVGSESLINRMQKYNPGDEVTMLVKRGEEMIYIKAKLGKRPPGLGYNPQEMMGSMLSDRRGGFPSILQHDAVVKPADCGGPLVDLDGKVVGINIARAGRTETFAVPSEAVLELLPELMSGRLPPPLEDDGQVAKSRRTWPGRRGAANF